MTGWLKNESSRSPGPCRDLRRPLAHKLTAPEEILSAARAAGARFAPLADAASRA